MTMNDDDDFDGPDETIRAPEGSVVISPLTIQYPADQLFDAIVRTAARQIVEKTMREISDAVGIEVREQVNAQIAAKVSEVLDGTVQPTNEWGEAKGTAMSLREIVVKTAREFMGVRVDKEGRENSYNAVGTRLDHIVKKEVESVFNYQMQTEVKKAVEQARTEAVAKVGAVVGDLILKLGK
jgi:23S rRNA maturation mini-RNase III